MESKQDMWWMSIEALEEVRKRRRRRRRGLPRWPRRLSPTLWRTAPSTPGSTSVTTGNYLHHTHTLIPKKPESQTCSFFAFIFTSWRLMLWHLFQSNKSTSSYFHLRKGRILILKVIQSSLSTNWSSDIAGWRGAWRRQRWVLVWIRFSIFNFKYGFTLSILNMNFHC